MGSREGERMPTPEGRNNWGRWGPDDERGALNLLTPEVVADAATLCRTGKVYPLGLPIQPTGMPVFGFRGAPRRLSLRNQADEGAFVDFGAPFDLGANEDVLVLASHNETHLDALSHVYSDGALYNGFPAASSTTAGGAIRCGVEKVGTIVGRGVLLDLPTWFGVEWLEPGFVISGEHLEACAHAQGTDLRAGDVVLVRTGFLDMWFGQGAVDEPGASPGLGIDAASFVTEHDFAVVGADNAAIEAIPFDKDAFLTGHVEMLVKHGIHLIEFLNLSPLALDGVTEFLFVGCPLPVTGAAGSPINPVAIA
jgi:kynurenine formamidase